MRLSLSFVFEASIVILVSRLIERGAAFFGEGPLPLGHWGTGMDREHYLRSAFPLLLCEIDFLRFFVLILR